MNNQYPNMYPGNQNAQQQEQQRLILQQMMGNMGAYNAGMANTNQQIYPYNAASLTAMQPQNTMSGIIQQQGMMGSYQAMVGQTQGMFGQTQGTMGQTQGMVGQTQGMFGQTHGMFGQTPGTVGQTQGMVGQTQSIIGQNQGITAQNQGVNTGQLIRNDVSNWLQSSTTTPKTPATSVSDPAKIRSILKNSGSSSSSQSQLQSSISDAIADVSAQVKSILKKSTPASSNIISQNVTPVSKSSYTPTSIPQYCPTSTGQTSAQYRPTSSSKASSSLSNILKHYSDSSMSDEVKSKKDSHSSKKPASSVPSAHIKHGSANQIGANTFTHKSTTNQMSQSQSTNQTMGSSGRRSQSTNQTTASSGSSQSAVRADVSSGKSIPTLVSVSRKRNIEDPVSPDTKKRKSNDDQTREKEDHEDEDPEYVQAQIFIGNIDAHTSKEMILEILRHYKFPSPKVWIGRHAKTKKICAFVKLPSLKDSKRVIAEMKGFPYKGREMDIRFSAAADFIDYNVSDKDKALFGASTKSLQVSVERDLPVQTAATLVPVDPMMRAMQVGTDYVEYQTVMVPVPVYPAVPPYGAPIQPDIPYTSSDGRYRDHGLSDRQETLQASPVSSQSLNDGYSHLHDEQNLGSRGYDSKRKHSRSPDRSRPYHSSDRPSLSPNRDRRLRRSRSRDRRASISPTRRRRSSISPSRSRRPNNSPLRGRRPSVSPSRGRKSSVSPSRGRRSNISPSRGRRLSNSPSRGRRSNISPSRGRRSSSSPSRGRRSNISPSRGRRSSNSPSRGRRSNISPSRGRRSSNSPSRVQRSNISPSRGQRSSISPSRGRRSNISTGIRGDTRDDNRSVHSNEDLRSQNAPDIVSPLPPSSYCVFINNLPPDLEDSDLETLVNRYPYDSVRLKVQDGLAEASINFNSRDEAEFMLRDINQKMFLGVCLNVTILDERTTGSVLDDRASGSLLDDRASGSLHDNMPGTLSITVTRGDEKRNSLFQSYIDASYANAPVLGRRFIKEYVSTDLTTAYYLCILCEKACSWRDIADHVMGYRHRLKSIRQSHRKIYDRICLIQDKGDMMKQCTKYASELVDLDERINTMKVPHPEQASLDELRNLQGRTLRDPSNTSDKGKSSSTSDTKQSSDSTSDIMKRLAAYKKKFEAVQDTSAETEGSTTPAKRRRGNDSKTDARTLKFDNLKKQNKSLADSIVAEIASARQDTESTRSDKKSDKIPDRRSDVRSRASATEKKSLDNRGRSRSDQSRQTALEQSKSQSSNKESKARAENVVKTREYGNQAATSVSNNDNLGNVTGHKPRRSRAWNNLITIVTDEPDNKLGTNVSPNKKNPVTNVTENKSTTLTKSAVNESKQTNKETLVAGSVTGTSVKTMAGSVSDTSIRESAAISTPTQGSVTGKSITPAQGGVTGTSVKTIAGGVTGTSVKTVAGGVKGTSVKTVSGTVTGKSVKTVAGGVTGTSVKTVAGGVTGTSVKPIAGSVKGTLVKTVAGGVKGTSVKTVAGSVKGTSVKTVAGGVKGTSVKPIAGSVKGTSVKTEEGGVTGTSAGISAEQLEEGLADMVEEAQPVFTLSNPSSHPKSKFHQYLRQTFEADPEHFMLIGLEYIIEISPQAITSDFKYYCSLCDLQTVLKTCITHFMGFKHRSKYMNMHDQEMSNIKKMSSANEYKLWVNSESLRLTKKVLENKKLQELITMSHVEFKMKKVREKKAVIDMAVPKENAGDEMAKDKGESTKNEANLSLRDKIIEAKQHAQAISMIDGRETVMLYQHLRLKPGVPILGLNRVFEIQGLYGARTKCATYICTLCNPMNKIDGVTNIYEHLVGNKHMENYLNTNYPDKMIHLKLIKQNSAKSAYLLNQAKLVSQNISDTDEPIYMVNLVALEIEREAAELKRKAETAEEAARMEAQAVAARQQKEDQAVAARQQKEAQAKAARDYRRAVATAAEQRENTRAAAAAVVQAANAEATTSGSSSVARVTDLSDKTMGATITAPKTAHIYGIIAGLQNTAVVGLSYITEIHGVPEDRGSPRYLCSLCHDEIITVKDIKSHLIGNNHMLNFLKVNYPVFYSTASGNYEAAGKYCEDIEEQFGRESVSVKTWLESSSTDKVNMYTDPVVSKAPVYKTSSTQNETQQFEMETNKDLEFYKLLDYDDHRPLLGLQFVREVQHPMKHYAPVYECLTCKRTDAQCLKSKKRHKNIYVHVRSVNHRMNFFKENHPHIYKELNALPAGERSARLEKRSSEIEWKVGRGVVEKLVSYKWYYWINATNPQQSCPEKALVPKALPLNVAQQKQNEPQMMDTEEEDAKEDLEFYKIPAEMRDEAPLLGLQFVSEVHHPTLMYEPVYECLLCKIKGDMFMTKNKVVDHLQTHDHNLNFCKEYHPDVYKEVTELSISNSNDSDDLFRQRCLEIEMKFGQGIVKKVYSDKAYYWKDSKIQPPLIEKDTTNEANPKGYKQNLVRCIKCEQVVRITEREDHLVAFHRQCYTCNLCDISFPSHVLLNRHNKKLDHYTKTAYVPLKHDKSDMDLSTCFTAYIGTLGVEQADDKGRLRLMCTKCEKILLPADAQSHYVVKHLQPYKCEECPERYGTNTELAKHLESVHNITKNIKPQKFDDLKMEHLFWSVCTTPNYYTNRSDDFRKKTSKTVKGKPAVEPKVKRNEANMDKTEDKLTASVTVTKPGVTGNEAKSNVSGNEAKSNVTANEAKSNVTGNEAKSNVSGNEAKSNVTANEAKSNVTGNEAKSNVTANEAKSNITGNEAKSNVTANKAKSNVAGNGAKSNVAGNEANSNVTGNEAGSNVAGNGAKPNVASNEAKSNVSGNKAAEDAQKVGVIVTTRPDVSVKVTTTQERNGASTRGPTIIAVKTGSGMDSARESQTNTKASDWDLTNTDDQEQLMNKMKKLYCIGCESVFGSISSALKHYNCTHTYEYLCPKCFTKFPSHAKLRDHSSYKHNITVRNKLPVVSFSQCFDVVLKNESRTAFENFLRTEQKESVSCGKTADIWQHLSESRQESTSKPTSTPASSSVSLASSTLSTNIPCTSAKMPASVTVSKPTSSLSSFTVTTALTATSTSKTTRPLSKSVSNTVTKPRTASSSPALSTARTASSTRSKTQSDEQVAGPEIIVEELLEIKEDPLFDWDTEYDKIVEKMEFGAMISSARKSKFIMNYRSTGSTYPVIGIQWITEFQKRNIRVAPWYICELCKDKVTSDGIIGHITSVKHRVNCMRMTHPAAYNHILTSTFTSMEALKIRVEKLSREAMKKEGGTFSIRVMIEIQQVSEEAVRSLPVDERNTKKTEDGSRKLPPWQKMSPFSTKDSSIHRNEELGMTSARRKSSRFSPLEKQPISKKNLSVSEVIDLTLEEDSIDAESVELVSIEETKSLSLPTKQQKINTEEQKMDTKEKVIVTKEKVMDTKENVIDTVGTIPATKGIIAFPDVTHNKPRVSDLEPENECSMEFDEDGFDGEFEIMDEVGEPDFMVIDIVPQSPEHLTCSVEIDVDEEVDTSTSQNISSQLPEQTHTEILPNVSNNDINVEIIVDPTNDVVKTSGEKTKLTNEDPAEKVDEKASASSIQANAVSICQLSSKPTSIIVKESQQTNVPENVTPPSDELQQAQVQQVQQDSKANEITAAIAEETDKVVSEKNKITEEMHAVKDSNSDIHVELASESKVESSGKDSGSHKDLPIQDSENKANTEQASINEEKVTNDLTKQVSETEIQTILENISSPEDVEANVCLENISSPENVEADVPLENINSPENVEANVRLENISSPENVEADVCLENISSPENVEADICLENINSPENMEADIRLENISSPENVEADVCLENITSPEETELPDDDQHLCTSSVSSGDLEFAFDEEFVTIDEHCEPDHEQMDTVIPGTFDDTVVADTVVDAVDETIANDTVIDQGGDVIDDADLGPSVKVEVETNETDEIKQCENVTDSEMIDNYESAMVISYASEDDDIEEIFLNNDFIDMDEEIGEGCELTTGSKYSAGKASEESIDDFVKENAETVKSNEDVDQRNVCEDVFKPNVSDDDDKPTSSEEAKKLISETGVKICEEDIVKNVEKDVLSEDVHIQTAAKEVDKKRAGEYIVKHIGEVFKHSSDEGVVKLNLIKQVGEQAPSKDVTEDSTTETADQSNVSEEGDDDEFMDFDNFVTVDEVDTEGQSPEKLDQVDESVNITIDITKEPSSSDNTSGKTRSSQDKSVKQKSSTRSSSSRSLSGRDRAKPKQLPSQTVVKQKTDNKKPRDTHVGMSLADFIENFDHIGINIIKKDTTVCVAGKICSRRVAGNKLFFFDLRADYHKIQIMASAKYYESTGAEFFTRFDKVSCGDILEVEGHPGKTSSGELSIIPKKIEWLHHLPRSHFGGKDKGDYESDYSKERSDTDGRGNVSLSTVSITPDKDEQALPSYSIQLQGRSPVSYLGVPISRGKTDKQSNTKKDNVTSGSEAEFVSKRASPLSTRSHDSPSTSHRHAVPHRHFESHRHAQSHRHAESHRSRGHGDRARVSHRHVDSDGRTIRRKTRECKVSIEIE